MNKQGKRIVVARKVTVAAVFVAVLASLAFDSGIGTPCSFGIGEFMLLCPLGGVEAMIASRSFIPQAALSLGVVLVLALVFGRAWCAWGCPAPVIRRFFRPGKKETSRIPLGEEADQTSSALPRRGSCHGACSPNPQCSPYQGELSPEWATEGVKTGATLRAALASIGRDTRTWALVCVLAAALVAGFPLFCLFCPIGLSFGTVASLWHLFVDKQVTASCIVFPLALLVELVAYKRWCLNLCPIAGLLNVVGHLAVLFRPRVRVESCLRRNGKECNVCKDACEECIDLHELDTALQLAKCTRCGECVRKCPTKSVRIHIAPGSPSE